MVYGRFWVAWWVVGFRWSFLGGVVGSWFCSSTAWQDLWSLLHHLLCHTCAECLSSHNPYSRPFHLSSPSRSRHIGLVHLVSKPYARRTLISHCTYFATHMIFHDPLSHFLISWCARSPRSCSCPIIITHVSLTTHSLSERTTFILTSF